LLITVSPFLPVEKPFQKEKKESKEREKESNLVDQKKKPEFSKNELKTNSYPPSLPPSPPSTSPPAGRSPSLGVKST